MMHGLPKCLLEHACGARNADEWTVDVSAAADAAAALDPPRYSTTHPPQRIVENS